jgi:Synaptobrevin
MSNAETFEDGKNDCILWSAVCRDGIILAEAGEDNLDGQVTNTAQGLLKKKDTPGYEFFQSRKYRCRGIKFHVFETDPLTGIMLVWKFAAVYHKELVELDQVKSFLEKIVMITMVPRETDYNWRYGDVLAAQSSFAPTLLQRMQEVTYMGRLAMVNKNIDGVKEIMASNIEAALSRGEKLEDMQVSATRLEEMSLQFKKNTRKLKRFQQWQNAKYGLAVGTLVTGVVACVTIPPLVALL